MQTTGLGNLSVVIPTYNGAKFIAEAIQSVLSQSSMPSEILVVDDCSTDHTLNVVRSMSEHSPISIRIIELETNSGGPSRPINIGVRMASSDMIAVLDQDDIFLPRALERASQVLQECQDCNFAFHWVGQYGVNETDPWQPEHIRKELLSAGNRWGTHFVLTGNQIVRLLITHGNFAWGYPGFVFRKAAWQVKGGVDESLRIASDMDFLMWMGRHGNAALIPDVGYLRRVHDANVTHASVAMSIELGRVVAKYIMELHPEEQQELGEQAVEAIESMAYAFRELRLYDDAMKFYSLLSDLGRSSVSVAILKAKCRVHRFLAHMQRFSVIAATS